MPPGDAKSVKAMACAVFSKKLDTQNSHVSPKLALTLPIGLFRDGCASPQGLVFSRTAAQPHPGASSAVTPIVGQSPKVRGWHSLRQ
jgi:hypothetical protein